MCSDDYDFAASLRAQRARADITQGELARRIGVVTSTIVRYESGEMIPSADKIWSMATALNCTPNDLCGFPAK